MAGGGGGSAQGEACLNALRLDASANWGYCMAYRGS